jgi:hypothetical protein
MHDFLLEMDLSFSNKSVVKSQELQIIALCFYSFQ